MGDQADDFIGNQDGSNVSGVKVVGSNY